MIEQFKMLDLNYEKLPSDVIHSIEDAVYVVCDDSLAVETS